MIPRIIAVLVFVLALSAGHRAEAARTPEEILQQDYHLTQDQVRELHYKNPRRNLPMPLEHRFAPRAAQGCPLPFILQNGTIPDAVQVMADFYALQACIQGGSGGGGGTPINLGLTVPPELTVTGSPYTGGSGVFAVGKAAESANTVWAGPTSGSPQPPTFRQLACADLAGGCGTPAATFTCASTPGSCPFSVPMFWPGVPPANQVVRISFSDAVTCPAGLSLSEGSAKTAATGTPVVGIYQSVGGTGAPTLVATATFTGAVPAFAAASAINFAVGDVIQYQFPASPDATMADVSLTLHCTRTTGFTIGSTGAPLPDANIWIGNPMGVAAAQVPSGDLSMTDTGVFTIGANAVTTTKINANAVTYAKLQTETNKTLLGNPSGSNAIPSEITLGSGLTFSGTTLTATGSGGTVTSVTCGTGLTGGTFTTTGTCAIDFTANDTWTGIQAFGEVHGTTTTVTLTSNNYNAVVGDCGTTKLLPTGTTPTVTLPNISPASASCTIVFITTAAKSYKFQAASGGTAINSQAFFNTRGTNAGDTVVVTLTAPSVSAATWNVSGDVTS